MSWIFYAMLAPLLQSVSNITDSFVRDKHVKDSIALGVFSMLLGTVIAFAALLFGVAMPTPQYLLIISAAGLLWIPMLFMYYKALSLEEASRIVPLFSLSSIFALLLSTIFLGEMLVRQQYFAFLLILLGSILVSVRRTEGMLKINKEALKFIILNEFLYAIMLLLMKMFYSSYDLWTGVFWRSISGLIGTLLLLLFIKPIRTKVKAALPSIKKVLLLVTLSTMLGATGSILISYALITGPVSLVAVVSNTHGFFVLIMAALLVKFRPGMLKEVYERKTLLTKALAITLIIAGLYLLKI